MPQEGAVRTALNDKKTMSNANNNSRLTLIVPYSWLIGLTFVVWVALIVLDAPLRNDTAPLGIVSLELAGTGGAARNILESWAPKQHIMAAASLGLDYLFLVLYPLAISQTCKYLATSRESSGSRAIVGLLVARSQLLAGPLDAVENAALLMEFVIPENMNQWASLAWYCAVPKFVIIAIGLLYISIGFSKHQCTVPQGELHRE